MKSVLWSFTFIFKLFFLNKLYNWLIDQHAKGQKKKDWSTNWHSTTVWVRRYTWGYREKEERERREESQERVENRAWTDTDTDVESTQSRQKKGQMKSIFLSDSDEEAIMDFVKQHEELYDKTNNSFKDKQKKEQLWEQLASTRNLPIKTVKKWFKTQRTRYGKLTQTKSGQAAEKSTEWQTWLKDSFRSHQKEGSFQVFLIQVTPEAVPDSKTL